MAIQPQSQPSSPLSTKFKSITTTTATDPSHIIPLDDPQRTTPIHPTIPGIKLPSTSTNNQASTLNPLTLRPFTADELKHHNYHALRNLGVDGAAKAREDAVAELRARLEESERRTREVEKEMEEKEKTREIERKVFMKRRGGEG